MGTDIIFCLLVKKLSVNGYGIMKSLVNKKWVSSAAVPYFIYVLLALGIEAGIEVFLCFVTL